MERGHCYTDWHWRINIESRVINNEILAHYDDYLWYEPKIGPKKLYPFGHGNGVIGTIFVKQKSNCRIEDDPRIILTEREKKTGRITFKRLRELEDAIDNE